MTETDLVRAILAALEAKGVWCWRMNSGLMRGTHKGKAWCVKLAPAGTPDILGILPGGKAFGIEVKIKAKLTPKQEAWGRKAQAHGARWGVARSVSDALGMIDEWKEPLDRYM